MNPEEKTVKEVNIHDFFVCAFKSQDFAQSQENCARSHDCETMTFRNSELNGMSLKKQCQSKWNVNQNKMSLKRECH